jgi:hypothetical protein
MHKLRRAVLFAALTGCALGGSAASASAAVSVTGPNCGAGNTLTPSCAVTITDSSGVSFSATLYGFPVTVTCSTVTYTGTVSGTGVFSIATATFSGCTDGLGGAVTVIPVGLPWIAQIRGNTAGHTGVYRLANLAPKFDLTPSFGAVCHYTSGTLVTTDQASPFSSLTYSGAGPLTSSTFGCGNGTLTGTYNLNKTLTVTGSLA